MRNGSWWYISNKSGSRERGNSWQNIATNVNAYNDFILSLCAVRDQFIQVSCKNINLNKARKEIAGTGLGVEELTEYEQLLENLIERYEESERRVGEI